MTINLWTLYSWNEDLFKDMVVPSAPVAQYEDQYLPGAPGVDKQTLIDSLLVDTYELEVCYAQPEIMQKLIKIWSERNLDRWQRIYNTYWYKYNPIWNKDSLISDTFNETRDLAGSSETNGDVISTHSVAGFNDPNTLTDNDKNVLSNDQLTTDTTDTGTIDRTNERRETGNLGLTMTQDMILKEREIQAYTIYDIIISDFKAEFILGIY